MKKGFIFIFYFFAKTSRTSWVQDYPDPPNSEASESLHTETWVASGLAP